MTDDLILEPRFAVRWFRILFAIDILVIAAHVTPALFTLAGMPMDRPVFLELGRDWALGEVVNYGLWLALVLIMLRSYDRFREVLFIGLAVMFAYALADDSMQLHEQSALFLPESVLNWKLPFYLQEIVFWAIVGLIVAVPLAYGWFAARPRTRRAVLPLLALFMGVVFCAIVFDLGHSLSDLWEPQDKRIAGRFFSVAEDGGEMIFLSATLAYAVGTFVQPFTAQRRRLDRQRGRAKHRAQGE